MTNNIDFRERCSSKWLTLPTKADLIPTANSLFSSSKPTNQPGQHTFLGQTFLYNIIDIYFTYIG
ncbi:hypothetical protein HYC85_013266 [Camellia sinensis]|uniref:Uncharacterized protein n=1 Tax=Camellia sinensis TaxID=4442 RepID=A0A7J7H2X6_CAMSI|nr:hypothetical protein HYC85_013266 [Camellia sinensis]